MEYGARLYDDLCLRSLQLQDSPRLSGHCLLGGRYEKLQAEHDALLQQKERRQIQAEAVGRCLDALEALELPQIAYTDSLWNTAVDHVTVFADDRLVFHFKNGTEIIVWM